MKVIKYGRSSAVALFVPETEAEHAFLNEELVTEEWMWVHDVAPLPALFIHVGFLPDLAAGCTIAGFAVREVRA